MTMKKTKKIQTGVSKDHPPVLPLMAIESSPVFPGLVASIHVPPGKSILSIKRAMSENRIIGFLLPKQELKHPPHTEEADADAPEVHYSMDELYRKGVSVRILKKVLMPDESMNILVHGIERFQVSILLQKDPYIYSRVKYMKTSDKKTKETEALARTIIQQVKHLSKSNPFFTEEMKIAMINSPSPGVLSDMVAFALSLHGKEAQTYLETSNVRERLLKLLVFLRKEKDMADVQRKLADEVDLRVEKFQREYMLKEQLKSIKKELGMEEDEKTKEYRLLKEKIKKADLPKHAQTVADQELRRLQTITEHSPEYHLTRNYIEWIGDLPWTKFTEDNLNLKNSSIILDKDHFGLKDVKDRILEFLAVRNLKPKSEGSILCFVGPPGVGKTSLGKAIAKALGRNFFRFSLGGMRDETEINGHRRTYVGAMPGKIIQALKRVGSNNALIMFDEVDKMHSSYHGDPGGALLEVLDPEQNKNFLDHYLDIPFDLSKIMFIATANDISTISPALRDRMEIIELPGYTQEEKEIIAKKHVIPRSLEKHGLKNTMLKIPVASLRKILNNYAREPGVRSLQQQMDKICRRTARMRVEGKRGKKAITVQPTKIEDWLGPQRFFNEAQSRLQQPGVMTGLAWTPMGGELLFIEAIALQGTGELKLTGKMGDVMTESAKIALSYLKKYLHQQKNLKLRSVVRNKKNENPMVSPQEWFKTHDIHVHIPSGAIPKDGPSAGITMSSALLSLTLGKLAQPKIAMTGELSLVGRVLPVGGVRDKVLAAKRSGIKHIILPEWNRQDLKEIPLSQRKGLKFSFVSHVNKVFDLVLR